MRTSLGRAQQISPDAHVVYRALVDGMVANGTVPILLRLRSQFGWETERLLDAMNDLYDADFVGRGRGHANAIVYPFSSNPTGVTVELDGVTRHAMCAIDALGVAPMLDRQVVVRSRCPVCERSIRIDVLPEKIKRRRPRDTVVIRRRAPGKAHATRCAATRFACSPRHAEQWLAEHGGPHDVMASLEGAFIEATQTFGAVYREGRCNCCD